MSHIRKLNIMDNFYTDLLWEAIITVLYSNLWSCVCDSSLPCVRSAPHSGLHEALNTMTVRKSETLPGEQTLSNETTDVRRTLKNINLRKAAGADKIPGRLLRECTDQLAWVHCTIMFQDSHNHTSPQYPACMTTTP